MHFACWINKATHTLRIYNTYCSSTPTIFMRTHLNVTLYLLCLSCQETIFRYSNNQTQAAPTMLITYGIQFWIYFSASLPLNAIRHNSLIKNIPLVGQEWLRSGQDVWGPLWKRAVNLRTPQPFYCLYLEIACSNAHPYKNRLY
jgi:hypothetical protein